MPVEATLATKKLYIIAGEASGDLHGANLIRHLKARSKHPLDIYGVGGDKIKESGAKNFYDLAHFHVTGITAAIKKYPDYKKAARRIFSDIEKTRPDLVVLIDNPGFNLHMAEKIHKLGIPIVYFIAPQVWAWAPKRVLKIKKFIKKVLVVFQFEKEFFEKHGVSVAWVGHPLKDFVETGGPAEANSKRIGRLITLLPGSRKGEINTLFSIFLKAASLIRSALPGTAFAVIKAPTLPRSVYDERLKKFDLPVQLVEKYAYDVIHDSELVIACSGTATLECAILGAPMIIANKGSLVTYLVAKSVIRVPFLGLPNLILGEKRFPELLQYEATPEKIAQEAVRILTDKKILEEMKKSCAEVSRLIGDKGASARAAEEVLALL
jgi:lipid-A-disaccharide synthase